LWLMAACMFGNTSRDVYAAAWRQNLGVERPLDLHFPQAGGTGIKRPQTVAMVQVAHTRAQHGLVRGHDQRPLIQLQAPMALRRPTSPDAAPSHSPPRIYTSLTSGRKYMATVLGLADDADVYGPNGTRLPSFSAAWARAWPGLHMQYQPTFVNHPELRGYGIAAGTYLALTLSAHYLKTQGSSCDYHLMFEDDARPFYGTSWPASSVNGVNDLDARIDALVAANGTALLLGGHHFKNVNLTAAAAAAARPHGGIVPFDTAEGAYAYVMHCSTIAHVARHLHSHLRRHVQGNLHIEHVLWSAFTNLRDQGTGTGVYVSAPLMVDHARGFSATWNRTVDRPYEGNATFW
ncbi:MAG: hypothetical protein ACR2IY_01105, partial [Rubrivivax sp.]